MIMEAVREAMENKGENPSLLSKMYPIKRSQLYRWFNGEVGLSIEKAEILIKHYKLSIVIIFNKQNNQKMRIMTDLERFKKMLLEGDEECEIEEVPEGTNIILEATEVTLVFKKNGDLGYICNDRAIPFHY